MENREIEEEGAEFRSANEVGPESQGTAEEHRLDGVVTVVWHLEDLIVQIGAAVKKLSDDLRDQRTTIQKVAQEEPDSITLGTPGNGQIKVYGDLKAPEAFKVKIDRALDLVHHAQANKQRNGY